MNIGKQSIIKTVVYCLIREIEELFLLFFVLYIPGDGIISFVIREKNRFNTVIWSELELGTNLIGT